MVTLIAENSMEALLQTLTESEQDRLLAEIDLLPNLGAVIDHITRRYPSFTDLLISEDAALVSKLLSKK